MPTGVAADTIVLPYNDVDAVAAAVARYGEGLAAIVVEPVAGNMGVVPPAPGFLEALRALCDASGALLVFDEVITGFRVARGGAQERYGVLPDLTILGKIVGGGLPAAAFGGRADVMARLAPVGDVYQAGTLSGNPLATAAGLSVLRRLREPAVYEELEARGARLEAGLAPYGRVQRVGAMLTLFCQREPVRDFEDASRVRHGARTRRSSATCSSAVSTSRRPSSSACSSRSRTATRRSTGRSRPLATSSAVDIWETLAAEAAAESPLWGEALRPRRRARAEPVFSPLCEERYRPRRRDDLRGLPPPLRAAAAVRAGGRGHRAPARRLPLRARPRPHRRDGKRRGGRATSPS